MTGPNSQSANFSYTPPELPNRSWHVFNTHSNLLQTRATFHGQGGKIGKSLYKSSMQGTSELLHPRAEAGLLGRARAPTTLANTATHSMMSRRGCRSRDKQGSRMCHPRDPKSDKGKLQVEG
jgi:hypothetical protein